MKTNINLLFTLVAAIMLMSCTSTTSNNKNEKNHITEDVDTISIKAESIIEEKVVNSASEILDKKEVGTTAFASSIGVLTFFMSPVGMTIFLGETLSSRVKDPVKRAARAI